MPGKRIPTDPRRGFARPHRLPGYGVVVAARVWDIHSINYTHKLRFLDMGRTTSDIPYPVEKIDLRLEEERRLIAYPA
jgi:hypothetical protein